MNAAELDKIIYEGKPAPHLEQKIAGDARAAVRYAFNCLKGPFPAAEPAISKDADWSYAYAVYVLQGRFAAGEVAIARNEVNQTMYARLVPGVRIDQVKQTIKKGERSQTAPKNEHPEKSGNPSAISSEGDLSATSKVSTHLALLQDMDNNTCPPLPAASQGVRPHASANQ